jgi:hypothetical protein
MRAVLADLWPVSQRWTAGSAPQSARRSRLAGPLAPGIGEFCWVLAVVGLFSLVSVLGNAIAQDGVPPGLAALWQYVPYFVQHYCLLLLPSALFVGLADRVTFEGGARTRALAGALATGAACTGILMAYVDGCVFQCPRPWTSPWVRQAVQQTVYAMSFASAVALVHFSQRRDKAFAAALHDSELARLDSEREHLRATLTAMQARVEPSFLLATLRDVGALCERDRTAGMRMLEMLSRYLRTALPQMRDSDSSVARETDLVRAYLDIAALRSGGNLTTECAADPQAASARLAPMLLLPLVAAAAQGDDCAGSVVLRACCDEAGLRITIDAQGPMATRMATCAAIDEVRERLAAIHGARATLTLEHASPDTCCMQLQLPDESTHRDRR